MECLVRIQETSTGNDQPDHEPNSDYGHCHGVEVTLEPALDEALPFDRIDAKSFARYSAQHFVQASKGEKSKVRSIQNPAVHIVESSKEQAQANGKVSYIRHRDNDFS